SSFTAARHRPQPPARRAAGQMPAVLPSIRDGPGNREPKNTNVRSLSGSRTHFAQPPPPDTLSSPPEARHDPPPLRPAPPCTYPEPRGGQGGTSFLGAPPRRGLDRFWPLSTSANPAPTATCSEDRPCPASPPPLAPSPSLPPPPSRPETLPP